MRIVLTICLYIGFTVSAFANPATATHRLAPAKPESASKPNIKYKSGKDVDFEALLIQGQMKRAEISVVTGDVQQGSNGLLRLREDFVDRIAADAGEEFAQEGR